MTGNIYTAKGCRLCKCAGAAGAGIANRYGYEMTTPATLDLQGGGSARVLEARIMRIGCGVHHGCWMRTDARGAGLGGRKGFGLGSHTGGAEAGGSRVYRRCVASWK
jgi:hypothetical protein